MCAMCMLGVHSSHKRILVSLELEFHCVCECWELNPGSLTEQPVILTTEPFIQPGLGILFFF